ncbi:MAG: Asp-tRNA(Asn)/Glu-tRNA(Gln) amidotransferase subunit GatC [Anaerolineae bacterium]|nr:Asp-tRNA(Asn)/Glu-tRNA(Gln) amidotransferase subunit GatC [Anaerolineae bacterium]
MALSRDEVEYIAKLARLALDDAALMCYQEQLSKILDYATSLQTVATEDISPAAIIHPLHNVLRDDVPTETLERDATLKNSPVSQNSCFVVPSLRP